MVRSCAAYNCKERFIKKGTLSFHSFPSDPQRRKRWIIATKRANFMPIKYSQLCSKHFKEDCFETNRFGNARVLKPDAVPSVFDFPEHLKKSSPKRRGTKRKLNDSRVMECRRNLFSDENDCAKNCMETLDEEVLAKLSNSDATSSETSLIVHAEIKGSENANSVALDATSILHVSARTITVTQTGEDMMDTEEYSRIVAQTDHDYCSSNAWHLTIYAADVIAYIAGFVVKRLKACITCQECLKVLESEVTASRLQVRKTYGRLVKASKFVIDVCKTAEKCIRYVTTTDTII